MKAHFIALAVLIVLMAFFVVHVAAHPWTTGRVIGACLAAATFPLVLLSCWQLGSSYALRPQARMLVTHGLYARIRNPIYVFSGVMIAGMSLFVSNWGPLVVAIFLTPVQVFRAHKEEQLLARTFGQDYTRYKQQTWF